MNEIRITDPRFSYLIPLPFLLLLIGVAYWAGFANDEAPDNTTKIITAVMCIVGGFLFVYFLRQFFNTPVILLMNEQGFEYNPAGVSTGFILWKDVEKVEELSVLVSSGAGSSNRETALGIWLKEPDRYLKTQNVVLRKLIELNQGMYGASVLIQPSSLGKDYTRVRKAFQERTLKSPIN